MGNSSSQPQLPEGFEFPPPPQTRDELRDRYGYTLFGASGFHTECRRRLEVVFDVFCTISGSTKHWSESNLTDFIQSTFPLELTPILNDAIPVLHRFVRRLGSFPYQNDPEELLTYNVLQMAVILLIVHDEKKWTADQQVGTRNSDPLADFRVVIFQSLTTLEPSGSKEGQRQRSEEDDFHLKEVLDRISSRNYWRDPEYPKWIIPGPEYPASDYSSTWSKDLHGSVPMDELRSLLRLFLVAQLYRGGIDVQAFSNCLARLENITDCVLAAFDEDHDTTGISWEVFDRVVKRSMPRLLFGWARLFGPLYSTEYLGGFPASPSVPETQNLFRDTYLPLFQQKAPTSGVISDLPILSQLAILMPTTLQIEAISVCWSVTGNDQLIIHDLLTALRKALTDRLIILISGSRGNCRVVFGALLTKTSNEAKPQMMVDCLFQLEPVYRGFCPPKRDPEDSPMVHNDKISILIAVETESLGRVELLLDETGSGRFTVLHESTSEQSFCIDAVEVLSVNKGRKSILFI